MQCLIGSFLIWGVRETVQQVTLNYDLRMENGGGRQCAKNRSVLHNQNEGTYGPKWGQRGAQGHLTEIHTIQSPEYTVSAPQKTLCGSWFSHPLEGQNPGSESLASGRGTATMTLLSSVSELGGSDPWPMSLQVGPLIMTIDLGTPWPPHCWLHSLLQVCPNPFQKPSPNPFSPIPCLGTAQQGEWSDQR